MADGSVARRTSPARLAVTGNAANATPSTPREVEGRPRLVLAPAALSSDYDQNRRSAARLAELRPRLTCFGHGFAVTDPGRFAAAIDQLGPTSS